MSTESDQFTDIEHVHCKRCGAAVELQTEVHQKHGYVAGRFVAEHYCEVTRGGAWGTCENPRHDSKPQEWHPRNDTCIDWHPGPDRPAPAANPSTEPSTGEGGAMDEDVTLAQLLGWDEEAAERLRKDLKEIEAAEKRAARITRDVRLRGQ